MTTAQDKIRELRAGIDKVRGLLARIEADKETPMRCDECGEAAELICVDCEDAFCPEHLHQLGGHWLLVVCGECMDREMATAS